MHCREALEQLEAVRPGDGDCREPELADAAGHMADCDDCRAEFNVRQRQDVRIADVLCDVPVPADLKSRILSALQVAQLEPAMAVAEISDAEDNTASRSSRHRTRRWWLTAVISVSAVCTLFGVLFWKTPPVKEPGLSLADIRRDTTLNLSRLDTFDGRFEANLPGGEWQLGRLQFDKQPKGDFRGSNGGPHRAALYGFTFRGKHDGDVLHGVLLVMPRHELENPPNDSQFTHIDTPGNYARRPGGTFHAIAWTEGDRVYVCFVSAVGDSLERLTNALTTTPA